jgi:hypothetical protein
MIVTTSACGPQLTRRFLKIALFAGVYLLASAANARAALEKISKECD